MMAPRMISFITCWTETMALITIVIMAMVKNLKDIKEGRIPKKKWDD